MVGQAIADPIPYYQAVAAESAGRLAAATERASQAAQVQTPPSRAPNIPPPPPAPGPDRVVVDSSQTPRRVVSSVPAGFEDLDQSTTTDFDIVYLGRVVGSFRATLDGAVVRFEDPAAVATALGSSVSTEEVVRLLSAGLPTNTQLVCPPGDTFDCGALPPGVSGVIVNSDRFRIDVFLAREYLVSQANQVEYLPPAVSGFSFVQNAALSLSGESQDGDTDFRFGGALDTYASVGQTALVARTLVDQDRGVRVEQLYGQRVWRDYRAAAGFLQSSSSATTSTFRFVGAEFGSFNGTQLDRDRFTASPIEVVLPQRARVEIYRGGTLSLARDYDAGLQTIDTQTLPSGTYPIRVVIRNGGTIISEETRVFTKAGDLPPPGKTFFSARVGQRVSNIFNDLSGQDGQGDLFPEISDDFIAQVTASRRIGRATGVSASLLSVGSELYPEVGIQTYLGPMRGVASITFGPDGGYSALGTLSTNIRGVSAFATVRSVRAPDDGAGVFLPDEFRPFFRSEDEYSVNLQMAALGGNVSLRAQQATSDFYEDRYTYGANYSREIGQTRYGNLRFNVDAFTSDRESRVGVSLSLFRRLNPRTFVRGDIGAETISGSPDENRNGTAPVLTIAATRLATVGDLDLSLTAGAETNQTEDRLYGRGEAYSRWGSGDAEVSVQSVNGDDPSTSLLANFFSGFVYGGGQLKLGMRQPGEAAILFSVKPDERSAAEVAAAVAASGQPVDGRAIQVQVPTNADGTPLLDGEGAVAPRAPRRRFVSTGDYRAVVDDQAFDIVTVGKATAVGLPAYGLYEATLEPRGAPPFDLDLAPRQIPLYVGNVVLLEWSARRVISVYGRLLGNDGQPLRNARVEAGQDVTLTDDNGYFTITAPADEDIRTRRSDGTVCRPISLNGAESRNSAAELYRLGDVVCRPWVEQ